MRILHVLDHSAPLHSGYTYRTLAILSEQRARGWDTVHVTSPKHASTVSEEDAEGYRFYRTPPSHAIWAKLPVMGQAEVIRSLGRRLDALIPELSPDIVHAHSPALNGAAAVSRGRAHRVPVVYEVRAFWEDAAVDHGTSTEGGLRYRMTRALESSVLARADAVTTICEGLRRDIVARGIPEDRVTVVPNAVDTERFSTGRCRDGALAMELGLADKDVVGFVGSFYAYEGLELLLAATPALVAERPDIRVLLVGGGPEEARLRQVAAALGIEDRVVFTGRVPNRDVQRYYDLMDVLAYPRLAMRLTETVTPLKPLEAMAMGKVLVASSVGGHRELIRDGDTALLFPAGDGDGLARTVLRALTDRALRARLAENGRAFVESERTWSRSVESYRAIYERLAREHDA